MEFGVSALILTWFFTGWLSYWGTSSKWLLFQTARFCVCLWSVTFTVSSAWACWIEHFKRDACSRMVDMTSSTSFSASYPEVHGTWGRREWCGKPWEWPWTWGSPSGPQWPEKWLQSPQCMWQCQFLPYLLCCQGSFWKQHAMRGNLAVGEK